MLKMHGATRGIRFARGYLKVPMGTTRAASSSSALELGSTGLREHHLDLIDNEAWVLCTFAVAPGWPDRHDTPVAR